MHELKNWLKTDRFLVKPEFETSKCRGYKIRWEIGEKKENGWFMIRCNPRGLPSPPRALSALAPPSPATPPLDCVVFAHASPYRFTG
jgi:hypothetical protein